MDMSFANGSLSTTPFRTLQLKFRIDYDIINGIQKGCIRALCYDYFCATNARGKNMQEYCMYSFHPETVNQFKIPVENVSYNFTLPNDQHAFVPASLTFLEYQGEHHDRFGYNIDGCDYKRTDSYMYVNCVTLNSDKTTSPQRPTFSWFCH